MGLTPSAIYYLKKLQAVATNATTACCSPQNAFRISHPKKLCNYFFEFFFEGAFSTSSPVSFF